jgi:squalene-hopene/tetraprenyl-beta-curcumene cyclase
MAKVRPYWFRCLLLLTMSVGLSGCGNHDSEQSARLARLERALSAAAAYLSGQQSPEGDWRPDTYGAFKDGGSLTPLVLQALHGAPRSDKSELAYRKGKDCLAKMVQSDGSIDAGPRGLSYPVYTAANAVMVLSDDQDRKHREAWLLYLRARQLTEDLGWLPSDREYGGWGYASGLPRKPSPGQGAPSLTESNLSATVFALTALRAGGIPVSDPAFQKALVFVKRCQNYRDDSEACDPVYDDGGFFFIYDDSVRNKAGVVGTDNAGRERYASYGSTTADGLRAMLACGLSVSDQRVAAARSWLGKNFSATNHPGKYLETRLGDRPALYFYYCYSITRGFPALEMPDAPQPALDACWAEMLADELMKRQRTDGSWLNSAKAVREDEPVLATSFAALALAACRERLTGNAGR